MGCRTPLHAEQSLRLGPTRAMSHHHLGRILTPNSRQSHQRASIYYRPPVLFVTRPCARASPLVQFETKAAANIPHRVAALTSSLFKAGPNISRGLRMLSFPKLALQGMWIVAALVCSSNGAQASIQQVSPLPPAADMPISACSTCPPQMLFPEELLGAQPCAFGFMRGCIEDPTTLPPDHPNNPALGPVSPFATPPTGGCDQVRCLGVCYEADKRSKLAVRGGGRGRRGEGRVGMRADVGSERHARCPEAHRRARIAQE